MTTFLLFLLLSLALCGCGRAINRSAERRIRDALPDIIGPARRYRAHIANAPERTLQGRLANVAIDGDDVELSSGLLLDSLHLDLKGVEVDTERSRIRQIREARFTAAISDKSLDLYLAGESPPEETIRNTRVTLGENVVTIAAERVVLGVGVPFRMTGPLRLNGPQRIEIDPTRLVVVGIPFTGKPLQFLKSKFESGIDLSMLAFPVSLTSVQTQRGQLILTGTADVTAILRSAQGRQR